MSVFVKICGLANASDIEAVAALEPDAMGFIFYPKSPRAVTADQVARWTADVPPSILKVGVTVDLPDAENLRIAEEAELDVIQLHGRETDWTWKPPMLEIWKVVHLDQTLPTLDGLDTLLIDSYTAELPGGTGHTVDWDAAADFVAHAEQRVLLAGGLTPENLPEALERVQPWGVDVSSGVEAEPGRKDLHKVKAFIETARA